MAKLERLWLTRDDKATYGEIWAGESPPAYRGGVFVGCGDVKRPGVVGSMNIVFGTTVVLKSGECIEFVRVVPKKRKDVKRGKKHD